MLQSSNAAAISELASAPDIMNQMDATNRLNNHVVMPLPAIQSVAGIELPASQSAPVLPLSGSASTLRGWCCLLVCAVVDIIK